MESEFEIIALSELTPTSYLYAAEQLGKREERMAITAAAKEKEEEQKK